MNRDLDRLGTDLFDLLIIGGGIHGLAIAHDAALRGLRTALVERHDFGAGTSFNHHRTLHGGLRYLQSGDLRRMRESIRERRTFARIAPQFIAPQPFLMPTMARLSRSAGAMRAAFALDALVAVDRNRHVPANLRLPAGRVLSRRELLARLPEARAFDATGAALWYDYRTEDADRLTLAFGLAAARNGATLVNYADAIEPLRTGQMVAGMRVRDAITGSAIDVRARVTVNAAGAGAGRVMAAFGTRRAFPLLKAMNLVTSRSGGHDAFAAPTASGRLLVALPWRGRLTIGTSHGDHLSGPDDTRASATERDSFLAEVNTAFPWLQLTPGDVALVHRGIVPAQTAPGRLPELLDRAEVRDHARDGIEGAISVVGVKYTTARAVAEHTVDLACRKLGGIGAASRSASAPLVDAAGAADAPADVPDFERLRQRFGSRAAPIMAVARADASLGACVSSEAPTIAAEIIEAIEHEMALTLEDVVVRRTGLGAAGHPGAIVVERCARIMQQRLGWSEERVRDEVEGVDRFYAIGEAAGADAGLPASGRPKRVEDPGHAGRESE
jgi:glycerol-3-phosphate dehydrogenase